MDLFRDKVLEIFKHDNEKLLRTFINNQFSENRETAITNFSNLLETIEGRHRLRLMEIFIEDGGKDLIPMFVETMKRERNLLFAKSLMFIYSNFDHAEALDALLPLEAQMTGELKAAYQRVAGKLKGRFRQKFYMKEFHDSVKNAKRMKHAASMMVKEPHPEYTPFLNDEILHEQPYYREKGVEVLAKIGDASSLDAMFELLPRLLIEREKIASLVGLLVDKEKAKIRKLSDYLLAIGKPVGWDAEKAGNLTDEVMREDLVATLEAVKTDFNIHSFALWDELDRYLSQTLKGETPTDLMRKRLSQALDTWIHSQGELMESLFQAIGEVGHREKVENLLAKADAYLDKDDPARERCMAAFLQGYKSEDGLDRLLQFLETGKSARFLEKILEALTSYKVEEIPAQVVTLANSSQEKSVRVKAMELLVKWGVTEEILRELLANESISVRADAVEMIAENRIEAGLPMLLEIIESGRVQASLLERVIGALEAFPGEATGKALVPFLFPPHAYAIRSAALEAIFEAGGDDRMGLLSEALSNTQDKRQWEVIGFLLKMLENPKLMRLPTGFMDQREFWMKVLNNEKHANLRTQMVAIFDKIDWMECEDYDGWIGSLNGALDELEKERSYDDKKKLRLMIHRARHARETNKEEPEEKVAPIEKKPSANLLAVLNKLETGSHHDRLRAIRQLNLLLKPESVDDELNDRIARVVSNFMRNHDGSTDLIKVGISIAIKSGHQTLLDRVRKLTDSNDEEIRDFARQVMADKGKSDNAVESVFLLDDSALFTKTLSRFLGKAGFEVTTANKPSDGLDQLNTGSFDLMVVDYYMPELSGVEFLKQARERKVAPDKTIFITSSRDREDITHILGAQVNALLLKPFPVEQLIDKIRGL